MDQTDHDLLIKLDTNMHVMCKKIEKFHDENKEIRRENREDHKEIFKLLETHKNESNNKIDKKVDFKYFRILVGILITVGIIFGTAGIGHINTSYKDKLKIETCIEQIIDKQDHVNHLYQMPHE